MYYIKFSYDRYYNIYTRISFLSVIIFISIVLNKYLQ